MNEILATILDYLPEALLIISAFFGITGSLGIVRMPDVYNRIHAETLCVVGGTVVGLLAIAVMKGISIFSLKVIIIAIFLFVTNPVGSHAIARAAHISGEKPCEGTKTDKLKEVRG